MPYNCTQLRNFLSMTTIAECTTGNTVVNLLLVHSYYSPCKFSPKIVFGLFRYEKFIPASVLGIEISHEQPNHGISLNLLTRTDHWFFSWSWTDPIANIEMTIKLHSQCCLRLNTFQFSASQIIPTITSTSQQHSMMKGRLGLAINQLTKRDALWPVVAWQ